VVLVLPCYETAGIDKPEIIEDKMGVSEPYLAAGLRRGCVIWAYARRFLATRCPDILLTDAFPVQSVEFSSTASGAYIALFDRLE
jgi:hypothetical protein